MDIKIPIKGNTGKNRNYCFVTFDSLESSSNAMKKNGESLDGKNIRVNYRHL